MTQAQGALADAERIGRIERGLLVEPPVWSGEIQRATLMERMTYHRTPGLAVAVIDQGEVAWARGYGVLEAGRETPVTADTIFQACSISKHVAMVGALRLVQDGLLDLDEAANRYLTSWQIPANGAWQPRVTVRHLLAHTAGLTYNWYRGFHRAEPPPTLLQVLEGQLPANTPPVRVVFLPGTRFRYSGSHYSVLQQLMVDVTDTPFPELLRALVLEPLGMHDSSYDQAYPEGRPETTAVGHYMGAVPVDGKWRVIPEMAGAGLWTTPVDLARLACALQGAHIGRDDDFLRRAVVDQALAPQIDQGYGLGTVLGGAGQARRFGHTGGNIGYTCIATAYAEHGLGAAVMTNGEDGIWVAQEILRAIAEEYAWPDYVPSHDVMSIDPGIAADFVGTYELRPGVGLTIAERDGALTLALSGLEPIELRASSETAFFSPAVNSTITFERGEDGQVAGLMLQQEGQERRARRLV